MFTKASLDFNVDLCAREATVTSAVASAMPERKSLIADTSEVKQQNQRTINQF